MKKDKLMIILRISLLIFLLVVFTTFSLNYVYAETIVSDQFNPTVAYSSVDPNVNAGFGLEMKIAQSFVPTRSADISSIELPLSYYTGTSDKIVLQVQTDNNNEPSGQLVNGNCYVYMQAFTTPQHSIVVKDPANVGWFNFKFNKGCYLNAGTKYWIVILSPGSSSSNTYLNYLSKGDTYNKGIAKYYNYNGNGWRVLGSDLDFIFVEYTYPLATSSNPTNTNQENSNIDNSININQENNAQVNVYANIGFGSTQKQAQSFVPSKTVDIKIIELPISYLSGTPSDIILRIESDSGGNPSGNLVSDSCTMSIPGFTSPLYPNYEWLKFPFRQSCRLTTGTSYWMVLSSLGSSSSNTYVNYITTNNNYANGKIKRNSGSSWVDQDQNFDFIFKKEDYINEPSSNQQNFNEISNQLTNIEEIIEGSSIITPPQLVSAASFITNTPIAGDPFIKDLLKHKLVIYWDNHPLGNEAAKKCHEPLLNKTRSIHLNVKFFKIVEGEKVKKDEIYNLHIGSVINEKKQYCTYAYESRTYKNCIKYCGEKFKDPEKIFMIEPFPFPEPIPQKHDVLKKVFLTTENSEVIAVGSAVAALTWIISKVGCTITKGLICPAP